MREMRLRLNFSLSHSAPVLILQLLQTNGMTAVSMSPTTGLEFNFYCGFSEILCSTAPCSNEVRAADTL